MKHFTSRQTVGRRLVICLLLTMLIPLKGTAQEICPVYPRTMDQVFVCYEPSKLKLEQNACLHNPVKFTFPALPSDIIVTFDAGDGNGPVNISTDGDTLSVSYPSPGQYPLTWTMITAWGNFSGTILFQSNFNNLDANYGDFLPHETWGDMIGSTYNPPISGAYPPGSPNTLPVSAGGIVHILYANPDHQMRKPFIFVEGFDPILEGLDQYVVNDPNGNILGYGGVRWDVIVTGRSESFDVDPGEPGVPHTPQFAQLPALIQGLRSRGYDIVYVDFADAGTYIQANAEFLIDVIERVNNAKITDEQNVLIGASMGGIVGRYALAKMEQENKTHCVGLFGTLDTPHNGANIPLALQGFAWFFHATGSNDLAWKALDSPAARQQLIQHIGAEVQAGRIEMKNEEGESHVTPMDFSELSNSDYGALRGQLSSDLAGIGWPQIPRKIAMLDGIKNGTLPGAQGYGPGDIVYDASGKADGLVNYGTIFKLLMRASNGGPEYGDEYTFHYTEDCIKYGASAYPHKLLLSVAKPHDFNPCLENMPPYKYNVVHVQSNADMLHLDNAPGGFRMDLRGINANIKSSLESQSGVEFLNPVKFPIATFVPTWSGLAMGTALTNPNLFVDLTTGEFQEQNLPNLKIPNFDRFYAPPTNLRHVELDGGMVAFIFEELDRLGAAPQLGLLTEVYNYGDKYKQIPNTIVASNGVLNINNPGPTGYVQSNPQNNATKPVFITYLNSCGQVITVESGGQYNIGALDKSQHGITEVWEGATVHIKSGGTLNVTSGQSKLHLKAGATLILDPGAIVQLDAEGAHILIEGDLVVNGDIKFVGLGYFDFGNGNQLVFGPDYNTFKLKGAGKDKRFVRLSGGLGLDASHRLNWRDGLVEEAGFFNVTDGAGLDFTNMTLDGSIGGSNAIDALNSGPITLQGCNVQFFDQPIRGDGLNGCTIDACEFSSYAALPVDWRNAAAVNIRYSTFDGAGATAGLLFDNVLVVNIKGSTFQGHGSTIPGPVDDSDLLGASAGVTLQNVTACLVNDSHFSENNIGISAPLLESPANVYVFNGSRFANQYAGIYLNGDDTRGAVLSDCSEFDNNNDGIRGRDISLMVDSKNSKIFAFDTDTPNRFIRKGFGPNGSYIHVCYDQKSPGASILMRNNFWGTHNSGGLPGIDYTPEAFIFLKDAVCSANIAVPTVSPINTRPPVCGEEERPASFANAAPGTECTMMAGGTVSNPITVHEQFHLGTFLMRADSFEAAIEALRPVAALWQPSLATFSDNCQQYIEIAKAFVDANDGQALARPISNRQAKYFDNLLIAPNPTNGSAVLHLSIAVHQIKIWDIRGKLYYQTTASGNYRLETAAWPSGIYLIDALSADGKRLTGKLIVQR